MKRKEGNPELLQISKENADSHILQHSMLSSKRKQSSAEVCKTTHVVRVPLSNPQAATLLPWKAPEGGGKPHTDHTAETAPALPCLGMLMVKVKAARSTSELEAMEELQEWAMGMGSIHLQTHCLPYQKALQDP